MTDSVTKTMFYDAKPHLFEKAKALRKNMTEAERLLWSGLSKKQLAGFRFKAQHPIDIFIADFYCHALKLVIEVDGGVHNSSDQKLYDEGRTAELEAYGIKVVRFTNDAVQNHIESVLMEILRICNELKKQVRLI